MKIFWFIPTHGDSRYLGTSKGARQVARAASDIKHTHAWPDGCARDGEGLPGPVQAGRHQVVHHVVLGRHRVKDLRHFARLFRLCDGLIAKMGGLFGLWVRHDGKRSYRISINIHYRSRSVLDARLMSHC